MKAARGIYCHGHRPQIQISMPYFDLHLLHKCPIVICSGYIYLWSSNIRNIRHKRIFLLPASYRHSRALCAPPQ